MGLLTAESLGVNNHIAYCSYMKSPNSSHLRQWSASDLESYLFYMEGGARKDVLFGGILFEADQSADGVAISPRSIGLGKPSKLHAWEQSLEQLFAPGTQIDALLCLSQSIPSDRYVDIWIALPYPMVLAKEDFGQIQGKTLNFSISQADRLEAVKWWFEQVLKRYRLAEQKYPQQRCRLQGFVWTKSFLDIGDKELICALSPFVKDRVKNWLWLQNYGTTDAIKGKEWGFSGVFTRPTFLQSELRGKQWIKHAVKLSSNYVLGMVLWADQRWSTTQLKELLEAGRDHFQDALQIYDIFTGASSPQLASHPNYQDLYAYIHHQDMNSEDLKGGHQ
ncbi:DUF4855 domain-containing protein [Marinicrinis lubricantis]|uniref:DUF4855 domain-containing protein n=1 Tax=Marinicrinis lubricantis TaxID=2086470 RepID=A0ABW1IQU5_9BACL